MLELKGLDLEIETLRGKREMLELETASYSTSTVAKVIASPTTTTHTHTLSVYLHDLRTFRTR